MLSAKIGDIYVGKPCETGEDEEITYEFQTGNLYFFIGNAKYFFVCQETSVHRIEVKMMIKEWVLKKITTLEGINRNCFQGLHLFHSSIVRTSGNGGEV